MNDYVYYGDGKLSVYCRECGHGEEIDCDLETADAVINRMGLIQDLLPNTPPEVREMFLSGWCGCCYDLKLMYFPKEALELLTEKMKELIPASELPDDFRLLDNDDVIGMLEQLEWYDEDSEEFMDLRPQLKEIRDFISELADRIDEGDFIKDMECPSCGWKGKEDEVEQEFEEQINDYVNYCPKCGRGF